MLLATLRFYRRVLRYLFRRQKLKFKKYWT